MAYITKRVQSSSVGGFTAGSVPFAAADGTLTEDNAALFWDAANDRLGIGTTTPETTVSLVKTGSHGFQAIAIGGTAKFATRRINGSIAAPTAVLLNQVIGRADFEGQGATTTFNGATLWVFANENWSDTAQGSTFEFRANKTGTTSLANLLRISHDNVTSIFNFSIANDAANFVFSTTTGTKFGTAVGQKLGFWNTVPVIQPAAEADLGAQAVVVNNCGAISCNALSATEASTQTAVDNLVAKVNNILAKLRSPGLIAT